MTSTRKPGRPPLTPEQRAERDNAPAKTKNITVDQDIVELLSATADKLAGDLGFRPTLSQTLRWLITKGRKS